MKGGNKFEIVWSPIIVDHFSDYFPSEWARVLSATFAEQSLVPTIASRAQATVQHAFDLATKQAQMSVESGFAPSVSYRCQLASEADADADADADAVGYRLAIEGLTRVLAMDRRNSRLRGGGPSLGDYFFTVLRGILDQNVMRGIYRDYAATAGYFGAGLFAGLVASGIRAEWLLSRYAVLERRFELTVAGLKQMAVACRSDDDAPVVLRHLYLSSTQGDRPTGINNVMFESCTIGRGALGLVSSGSFEDCEFEAGALIRCELTTFKRCSLRGAVFAEAYRCIFDQSPLIGDTRATLKGCWFQGRAFASEATCEEIDNCHFSDREVQGVEIQALSGSYANVRFEQCWIERIAQGSVLARVSGSTIGAADDVEFAGDLIDVDFIGPVEGCRFGGATPILMQDVSFGAEGKQGGEAFYRQFCDGEATRSRVLECRFAKGTQFKNLAFHCVLRDPVFECSALGITEVWVLDLTQEMRGSFHGVAFNAIQTRGRGMVSLLVGGRVEHLRGHVARVAHALIGRVEAGALIDRYEVITSPVLHQKWGLEDAELLIEVVDGVIGAVACVGRGGEVVGAIGELCGTIDLWSPCVPLRHLRAGGTVVLAQEADPGEVFAGGAIGHFDGGKVGVWAVGSDGVRYQQFFTGVEDYEKRAGIDLVGDLFDDVKRPGGG